MNLTQLRNSVYSKIGLDSTTSGNDETLVTQWLNQGVREVLLRTHCYVKCIDLTLVADTWKYELPSSALAFETIVDSENNVVDVISPDELLDLRRSSTTGDTRLKVAFMGSNLLLVWPTPTAADTLEAFYVPKAIEMSTGSHDPSNATYGGVPTELHYAIELWALAQASDFGHEQRTRSGANYLAQFEDYIRRVGRATVNRKGGKLPPVRVGRRSFVQSRNDTYPAY